MSKVRSPLAAAIILVLIADCLARARVSAEIGASSERITSAEFKKLMQTMSEGWNEGDAKKAADCYTDDAIYSAPPDPKYRQGKQMLFEFFGGKKGREAPMKMAWHHLAFDEETQIGFGEYTFAYKDYQAHGVVTVKASERKISNWRERETQSDLSWQQFVGKNAF
jgi:ketosteroid isomerase-like protein